MRSTFLLQAARAAALVLAIALPAAQALAGDLQVSVVDRDGQPVQDAVVVLVPAARGMPKVALPTQAVISQEKMRFVPGVSLVALGARGHFVNNDSWDHHVRASPAGAGQFQAAGSGAGFELMLDGRQDGKPAKTADASFDRAGALLLGCHLHSSMRGFVYVSESPWAALTTAEGGALFEGVPEGQVQVRVWQADQLIDLPPQQLVLGAAAASTRVQLNVVPKRRRI